MVRVSAKTDEDAILQRVGVAIRAARTAAAMSQEGLAHAAEMDRSHMGRIERGERNLTLMNLVRIARALNCAPSDLLARAEL